MNLGERIRILRKKNNLSQEQLAEKLNVSRQAISKWESNTAYPDISNLILLRDIFGVTLDYLVIDNNTIENQDINEDYEEEDNESNLMLGGFIIGTAIGVITGNFLWVTAGSFLGLGAGYVLKNIRIKSN